MARDEVSERGRASALLSRFSRTRGLPSAVHAAWLASLPAAGRILAWAPAEQSYVVGSPALLSVGDADGWRHTGWHTIEHGGWNADLHQLSWTRLDGGRGSVRMLDPARLPELFRERVEATIAVRRFVPVAGERGIVVSARRDLGPDGGLTWQTSLTRGLSWQTPGVRAEADAALDAIRTEFGLG